MPGFAFHAYPQTENWMIISTMEGAGAAFGRTYSAG